MISMGNSGKCTGPYSSRNKTNQGLRKFLLVLLVGQRRREKVKALCITEASTLLEECQLECSFDDRVLIRLAGRSARSRLGAMLVTARRQRFTPAWRTSGSQG